MPANFDPNAITYNDCLITIGHRNGQHIATIMPPDRSVMVNLPPVASWEEAISKAQAYLDTTELLRTDMWPVITQFSPEPSSYPFSSSSSLSG